MLFLKSLRNAAHFARELIEMFGPGYRKTYGYRFGDSRYTFDIGTVVFDLLYTMMLVVIAIPIDVLYVIGYTLSFIGSGLVTVLDAFRRLIERPTWIFWRKRSRFRKEIEDGRY